MNQILRIDPLHIKFWWPLVEDFFDEAVKHSRSLVSPTSILIALLEGAWVLWVVVRDKEIKAVSTTEPMETPHGLVCNLPFSCSRDSNPETVAEFLDHISDIAKEAGFIELKFISERPGMGRVMPKLGFKKGFIEYRRQL